MCFDYSLIISKVILFVKRKFRLKQPCAQSRVTGENLFQLVTENVFREGNHGFLEITNTAKLHIIQVIAVKLDANIVHALGVLSNLESKTLLRDYEQFGPGHCLEAISTKLLQNDVSLFNGHLCFSLS